MSHAELLVELHAQLLALTKYDFDESPRPQETAAGDELPPLPPGYEPRECPEYQIVKGVRKRQQRQCKVGAEGG
ncbi:hypothetical protein PInf_005067 [Phytophthora infestans]|nr:hypothetical protein PInf_005067 [Phytophthora infestans]